RRRPRGPPRLRHRFAGHLGRSGRPGALPGCTRPPHLVLTPGRIRSDHSRFPRRTTIWSGPMRPLLFGLLVIPTLACAHAASAPPPPSAPLASLSLFDGATLKGWDGDPAIWAVKDGAIDGTAEKGGKLLYTNGND